MAKTRFIPHGGQDYYLPPDALTNPRSGPASLPVGPLSGNKLVALFQACGWNVAPDSLSRSMGSAMLALASLAIAGATWRIRIGERVTNLERRAHGTPSGRASVGHWEAVGTIDTPRTLALWRTMIEALTGVAISYESATQSGGFETRAASQHYRRSAADGGEYGGTSHGRGRVGKSNPSMLTVSTLAGYGFSPASGFALLAGRGELIDASPTVSLTDHYARVGQTVDTKVRAARNARRKANRARNLRRARKAECQGHCDGGCN